jgi:hypothetical protein
VRLCCNAGGDGIVSTDPSLPHRKGVVLLCGVRRGWRGGSIDPIFDSAHLSASIIVCCVPPFHNARTRLFGGRLRCGSKSIYTPRVCRAKRGATLLGRRVQAGSRASENGGYDSFCKKIFGRFLKKQFERSITKTKRLKRTAETDVITLRDAETYKSS